MRTIKFHINIALGDRNYIRRFYFVYGYPDLNLNVSEEEITDKFDSAVKELNYIYKSFGRFVEAEAVVKLFKKYGFIETVP